jgi:hypothetical protein
MGVCFFPEKIVNWRAKLLRGNYKYKRVKLEDNEDDLNEGSHMLEREGDASTIEMRSRKRGNDDGVVFSAV